jgi:CTP synthase
MENKKQPEYNDSTSMKYLIVAGSTVSGVGKGTTMSCIGVLLQSMGFVVTCIKIDPYFNVDAGLMNPYEHGEVFVLDDGGETDLDLGNYERCLNIKLTRAHNITSGKVFQTVINNEREGKYLGRTVQMIPHVTTVIIDMIEEASKIITDKRGRKADICLIEIGGTVGDLESNIYLEAIRQFIAIKGQENIIMMMLTYVPSLGEQKTKPSQHGYKELKSLGLSPEFIICRSSEELGENPRKKIAFYCNVKESNVISCSNVALFWAVPIILIKQNFHLKIIERFGLSNRIENKVSKWINYHDVLLKIKEQPPVKIALCGKYVMNTDCYYSVNKALTDAGNACLKNVKILWLDTTIVEDDCESTQQEKEAFWKELKEANGILVPGGKLYFSDYRLREERNRRNDKSY